MEQFKEGDLVEAVKGTRVVRDVVTYTAGPLFPGQLHLGDARIFGPSTLGTYRNEGWTLTLIDRPKPKVELPTEPGVYIDKDGDPWPFKSQSLDPKWAPYTRVEPVPVTAKRVFERIESVYGEDYFHNSNESWNLVAREFGVTNG